MATKAEDTTGSGTTLAPLMAGGVPAAGATATGPAETFRPRRVTSLSIVVPAKDEAENLPRLLDELQEVLGRIEGVEVEVLVVDDGSADPTARIAREWGARVIRHAESLGNGAAVKRGIRAARHGWVLLLDGDGQHPPAAIPGLLEQAERYDLVVASRGGRGGSVHRNLANRIYNGLASYVTGRRIPDLTSGFRLVRADVAKGLVYLLPNTFSYPTTMTLAMLRGGFSVGFQPFEVRRRRGSSHIRLFRDGSRFFLIILRIATFFAPLRVFMPLAAFFAASGVGWYLHTWWTAGRFTNMAVLLLSQATVLFALGLISEQVAALRFERVESREDREDRT